MLSHFMANFPRSHYALVLDLEFDTFYQEKKAHGMITYDSNSTNPKPVSALGVPLLFLCVENEPEEGIDQPWIAKELFEFLLEAKIYDVTNALG